MTAQSMTSTVHPYVEVLQTIYADLTRIDDYAADEIVLHTADPSDAGGTGIVSGKQAVVAKERELIALTENTLFMDVQDIIANDYFGAVTGILRAHREDSVLAVPFCGLWRFKGGLIVEHWENAYDLSAFAEFFAKFA